VWVSCILHIKQIKNIFEEEMGWVVALEYIRAQVKELKYIYKIPLRRSLLDFDNISYRKLVEVGFGKLTNNNNKWIISEADRVQSLWNPARRTKIYWRGGLIAEIEGNPKKESTKNTEVLYSNTWKLEQA